MSSGSSVTRHFLMLLLGFSFITLPLTACRSSKSGASPAETEAINKLHQREIDASKAFDVDTLASLWTEDIVTLPPGGAPVIGKEANRASFLEMRNETRDIKITDYSLSFSEIKVIDDWAFEWGTFSGTSQFRDGEPVRSTGKLMRVLKREPDGWKIARAIYNGNAPEDGDQ